MINLTASDIRIGQATTVIDLTSNYSGDGYNPDTEGVWGWVFLNRSDLLTLKSKTKIINNLLNGRGAFTGVGRIPEQAIHAYVTRKK